jgi:hypothetical protein
MQKAFEQFDNNIEAVREMDALHRHLVDELKLPNDLSDILRAQFVYAVSALDKLVHELVRTGMLQAFKNQQVKTSKFNSFAISLETYSKIQQANESTPDILQLETPEYFFEQEVIVRHKHLSFQEPDKIADALSFIWEEKQKWQKIAAVFDKPNVSDDSVKKKLKNIVSRRNQIVHEADVDFQTNKRSEIDVVDVRDTVEFIYKLGNVIFNLVSSK